MAARVNTKFVIGLCAVLVLLAGFVAYALVMSQHDPREKIAKGDLLYAKGDYGGAVDMYSRAMRDKPSESSIILKYVDALQHVKVTDVITADQYVSQIAGFLRRANDVDPGNAVPYEKLMQFDITLAKYFGREETWAEIYKQSALTLQANPE